MLHARLFTELDGYREQHFDAAPADEPLLIAQFAGHDPATVLAAARLVEGKVSAMDLNFGCPQGIARKGRYGAFLLEETALLVGIVSALHAALRVPVTCKIRVLPTLAATVALWLAAAASGARPSMCRMCWMPPKWSLCLRTSGERRPSGRWRHRFRSGRREVEVAVRARLRRSGLSGSAAALGLAFIWPADRAQ
jgi:hypothetical protein